MSSIDSQATKLSMDAPAQSVPAAGPGRGARVVGYDLARCFAFFGMVIVNYRFVMGGYRGSPDWLLDTMELFTLRAAATFVMLAGVSMTLLWRARRDAVHEGRVSDWFRTITLVLVLALAWLLADFFVAESAADRSVSFGPLAGMEPGSGEVAPLADRFGDYLSALSGGAFGMFLMVGMGVCGALLLTLLVLGKNGWGPRVVLMKRVVFLAAVGFTWFPLWGGDILRFYAIYLFVGTLVLSLRWPWLIGLIVAVLTAAFWWQFVASAGVPGNPFGGEGNHWTLEAMARELFLKGFHPALPWLAFVFVGVLIGRIDTESWRAKGGLLALGLTLAVAGYAGSEPVVELLRDEQGPKVERHAAARRLVVAESSTKPATGGETAKPAEVVLAWPEGFDASANADFVAGAERLQKALARVADFATRSLSAAMVRRGDQERMALVMTVSYGEDRPAPAGHDKQIAAVEWAVQRFVNAERKAQIEGGSSGGEESTPAAAGAAGRWPPAIGLFAIERRMLVEPVGEGEREQVKWDTHWLDTAALLAPSVGRRWAGLVDPFGFTPGPGYMMTAMGVSMTVIALSLMLASFAVVRRVLRPFIVAGQMALTLYVAHVVVGFYVLKWIGRLQGENLTFIAFYVVCAWVAAVAFANWWRVHWRRGPLEAVMRWMTG